MLQLDPAAIAGITEYMFVPDDVLAADATIVLGMTLWHRPLQKAMQLHQDGLAGKLVFSGGYNPKIGSCEALEMRDRWVEHGYPENDLLLDAQSGNTRENMENSRRLLAEHGVLRSDMRVNLISITYHMRRAVETFRDVFGRDVLLGAANYSSMYCDPLAWFENRQGRDLVLGEIMKIRKYFPDRVPQLNQLLAGWCGSELSPQARPIESTDG